VLAIDRSAGRLLRVVENAGRMRATQVLPVVADVESRPPPVAPRSAAVVLVDAPCSGTGTLRRHPEIRHRLRPEQLRGFARRQAALLRHAAGAVGDGGRLIYAVCSIEPEEGPAVADAFEGANPGFRRVDARGLVPEPCVRLVAADGSLQTTPVDDLDGFFAIAFDRSGSA
jgi:16S rRNA (cytosine967-C5)-methyltransferase